MKLYFRLIIILVSHFIKKTVSRRYASESRIRKLSTTRTFRVLPTDIDGLFHMNNGRYLEIMDLGRIDFLAKSELLPAVYRRRMQLPVIKSEMSFLQPLKPLQRFELQTEIIHWDAERIMVEQTFLIIGPMGQRERAAIGNVELSILENDQKVSPVEFFSHFGLHSPKAVLKHEPLAIVGVGCRLPGGISDTASLWQSLLDGKDCIVDIPGSRWDIDRFWDPDPATPGKIYNRQGGFLEGDFKDFDASLFKVSPREAATMDPQQRLLLETSWEAFQDAKVAPDDLRGSRTGVFIGGFMLDNMVLRSAASREISNTIPNSITMTMLSNRLSYFYDFNGPSMSVDTACSSSLVAVHQACQSIWRGECEAAIAGGVNALLIPETQIAMAKGRFLSADSRCKAFDASADGYVRSEGAAVVYLKPLSKAREAGDEIYAVIRGTATNHDGHTENGISVPSRRAQTQVIEQAYKDANLNLGDVDYVEAHGTGTPIGDPIEAGVIGKVLARKRRDPLWVGSIKTNMGHLEAASGVTGLIKAALVVKHRKVPQNLHFNTPNPNIPFGDLNLQIPKINVPLEKSGPVIASVNSFGYGGSNAHIVLQSPDSTESINSGHVEDEGSRPLLHSTKFHLIPISAATKSSLERLEKDYRRSGIELRDLAWSAVTTRNQLSMRKVLKIDGDETSEFTKPENATDIDKLCMVFTGMGPQWRGMGRQLYDSSDYFREWMDKCDDLFEKISGWSILAAMKREIDISEPRYAQPANLVLQVSLFHYWKNLGVNPEVIVGHSVGEIAAFYASGCISLEQALKISFHRSQLQQRLLGSGKMLAAGLDLPSAEQLIQGTSVSIAAINSSKSVTLAGEESELRRVEESLNSKSIYCKMLKVNVPYHSQLMDEIKSELLSALSDMPVDEPMVPLISTVSGELVECSQIDAGYWWNNARQPVLFQSAIENLLAMGVNSFLEIGPQPVLANTIRECSPSIRVNCFSSLKIKQDDLSAVSDSISQIYVHGGEINWDKILVPANKVSLPKYPYDLRQSWSEPKESPLKRFSEPGHPFLKNESKNASELHQWTNDFHLGAHAYLKDHKFGESILFPAAAYIEIVRAISERVNETPTCLIENIEFQSPLVLQEGTSPMLVTKYDKKSSIVSHFNEGTLCCRMNLISLPIKQVKKCISPEELIASEAKSVNQFYAELSQFGLHYGPHFQTVCQIFHDEDGRSVTKLQTEEKGEFFINPMTLDGAFQSLLASSDQSDLKGKKLIPKYVDRIRIYRPTTPVCFAKMVDSTVDDHFVSGSLEIYDESGQLCVSVEGFACRVLSSHSTQSTDSFYRWEQMPFDGNIMSMEKASVLRKSDLFKQVEVDSQRMDIFCRQSYQPESSQSLVIDLRWMHWEDTCPASVSQAMRFLKFINSYKNDGGRYVLVLPKDSLYHSQLKGLARTAMNELVNLKLTLLEVESEDTDFIVRMGRVMGDEEEMLEVNGELFVRRLVRRDSLAEPASVENIDSLISSSRVDLYIEKTGQLKTLQFVERSKASLGSHEVEIQVAQVPLGFKDVMKPLGYLSDRVLRNTFYGHQIGMEGSGIVSAVGVEVSEFKPGDRVYALGSGFLSSHVTVNKNFVAKIPQEMAFTDCPSLIVLMTAYYSLKVLGRVEEGETVLIHGATGGLGLSAIEIARWLGAEVIATAGTEKKRGYLQQLGIQRIADSRSTTFAEDVLRWTDGKGVDAVLNFSPGEIFQAGLSVLTEFGRFIEVGKASFENQSSLDLYRFNKGITFSSFDLDRLLRGKPELAQKLAKQMLNLVNSKKVGSTHFESYPASQVQSVFKKMSSSEHIGRVMIDMNDDKLCYLPDNELKIDRERLFIVSGGSKGFGLEVAKWLIDTMNVKNVAVFGRSAESSLAELSATYTAKKANLIPINVDVSDKGQLSQIIKCLRNTYGNIGGVFHSAMVLDDKRIADIDELSYQKVLEPKALGAWNLHQLTLKDELQQFVVFSSISSVIGNPGQANYVAANVFLEELIQYRRRQKMAGHCINWGLLGETGVAHRSQNVSRQLENSGLKPIGVGDALNALRENIYTDQAQVLVARVDWSKLSKILPSHKRFCELMDNSDMGVNASAIHVEFEGWSDKKRLGFIGTRMCEIVGKVLQIKDVSPDEAIGKMGMDSVMGMEISAQINDYFQVEISAVEMTPALTVRQLSRLVLQKVIASGGTGASKST